MMTIHGSARFEWHHRDRISPALAFSGASHGAFVASGLTLLVATIVKLAFERRSFDQLVEEGTPEHFFTTIGAWKAGAGVIPTRWDLPEWERERLLETAAAVLLVGDYEGSAIPVVSLAELRATVDLDDRPLPDVVALPAQGIASRA